MTINYLKHRLISCFHFKYRYGYGVHSPFSYHLIKNVIGEKTPYYCYGKIESLRKELAGRKEDIAVFDSQTQSYFHTKIRNLAKKTIPARYGQLLFRLANHAKPQTIIHFGSSLGITTAYLASVSSATACVAIETCPNTAQAAKKILEACNCSNVSVRVAQNKPEIDEIIWEFSSVDFIFFDKFFNNQIKSHFYTLLSKVNEKSVFIFTDIHRTVEAHNAWEEIKNNEQVRVSIDLINLGIVYFSPELKKQQYKFYY